MAEELNGGNAGGGNDGNANGGDAGKGGAGNGDANGGQGGQGGTGGAAGGKGDGGSTVPESYEFKMPEGVELDTAAATEFTSLAKELKLGQDQAQKIASIGASMMQRASKAFEDKAAAQTAGWLEAAKTDKEFGGDKFDANAAIAGKAIDTFGTPALKEILSQSGLGNHPEMIRFALAVGKALGEDNTLPRGGAPGGNETSAAKKLYPNMN